MAKKWRGPWIGKSLVVPTATGTFRLKADAITESNFFGDSGNLAYCLSIVNDIDNPGYGYISTSAAGPYLLRATFDGATSIYLDSDITPTAIGSLPSGFLVVSAEVGAPACVPLSGLWVPDGINDPFKYYYQFSEAVESADWEFIPGVANVWQGFDYPVATLGYPTMAQLIALGMGLRTSAQLNLSGHVQWLRDYGLMNGTDGALQLRGTYYAP
jgi:hypothetical protein